MHLSEKYSVPADVALLYDFVNSLDLRRFTEHGVPHAPTDTLRTPAGLADWLRVRNLLGSSAELSTEDHRRALDLRAALRSFLATAPENRGGDPRLAHALNAAAAHFPLVIEAADGAVGLSPSPDASTGLGHALAQLYRLGKMARLDRIRMCASEECCWIFYDRSKPGNRRWCSSALCGNRQKTRSYRARRRKAA